MNVVPLGHYIIFGLRVPAPEGVMVVTHGVFGVPYPPPPDYIISVHKNVIILVLIVNSNRKCYQ